LPEKMNDARADQYRADLSVRTTTLAPRRSTA
jgi:hypothetical protein